MISPNQSSSDEMQKEGNDTTYKFTTEQQRILTSVGMANTENLTSDQQNTLAGMNLTKENNANII